MTTPNPEIPADDAARGTGVVDASGPKNPFLADITSRLSARLAERGEELRLAPDVIESGAGEEDVGLHTEGPDAGATHTSSYRDGPLGSVGAPPPGCDPSGDPARELVSLLSSVTDLADAEPATLTSAQRCHLATVLADARGRLDALSASAVGAVATHHDHLATGAKSPAVWLSARTEVSKRHAAADIRLHRDLHRYPDLMRAWRHGQLGTAKIRLLLHASSDIETQLERDQDALISILEPLTVAHAAIAIARWREHALAELDTSPDEPEPDPVQNTLTIRSGAGREQIATATLDRRTAAEFQRLLQAEIDRAFRTGDHTADDGLDFAARQADALLRLMRRGLETKTEFGRLRPSTINIVDLAALLRLSPDQINQIWFRPRETETGATLTDHELLDDLFQGSITSVLGFYGITGRFQPIGTITTNRLPDAAQRRLLQIRDGGCMHPGCDTPAHHSTPHHEPPYEKTGHTTVDELVLLCHHHHKLRHQSRNTYELDADGELTITAPDGTTHPTARPGRKLPPQPPPDPPPDRAKPPRARARRRSRRRKHPQPS